MPNVKSYDIFCLSLQEVFREDMLRKEIEDLQKRYQVLYACL